MHFETQSLQSFIFARRVVLKGVWNFQKFQERNFFLLGSLAKKYETPCFSVSLTKEWLRAWEWVSDCVSDRQSEAEVWLHALVRGYVSDSEIEG